MLEKNLVERLHEAANAVDSCGYQRPICAMRDAIGYGECENSHRCSCACDKDCLSMMLNSIARDVDMPSVECAEPLFPCSKCSRASNGSMMLCYYSPGVWRYCSDVRGSLWCCENAREVR